MLSDRQLEQVGVESQPDEVAQYRIGILLDLHGGSVQRIIEAVAKDNLLAIGIRLGQAGADIDKLARESYYWTHVPNLFLSIAQQIASTAAPEEDTRVDD